MSTHHRLSVIKRDGTSQAVSFDKITQRIETLSTDLDAVDPTLIAQRVIERVHDGIATSKLDELAAEICANLTTDHPDFGTLASRIVISNNHKMTPPTFRDAMTALYTDCIDVDGNPTPILSSTFYTAVTQYADQIEQAIDYQRDYLIDYFGFKTLEKAYLLKSNGHIKERPQHMWMRVSLGLYMNNIDHALACYHGLSRKYFIHATPTLFNMGTNNQQLLSCFLLGSDDSIEGMYKTVADTACIEKCSGGVGINLSMIRSRGSIIRGTHGVSNGLIPYLRVYNEVAHHVNQGGRRPGSIAIYLMPHHPDIMDFIDIRRNHGNEADRARELFTGLMLPDLFMRRVEADGMWSLFNPDRCPELYNNYGTEFERMYLEAEASGRYERQIPAQTIMRAINVSRMETGTPYILFTDAVNRNNNQSNLGMIRNSNLCAEILEYSDNREYACCTLASLALPTYVVENADGTATYDYDMLITMTRQLVRNLNRIVDLNKYPVVETERSNMRHRPIGIGVQGLADVYARMGFAYDSPDAMQMNKLIFESIYYGAVTGSLELSKEFGSYASFNGSPMSEGKFQFDLWGVAPPSTRYNWDELRTEVVQHGLRNSLLIALMPTASTAQILGNNECFEPFTSNVYKRQVTAGTFAVVNKYLIKDLLNRGLWNREMKERIIMANGSVQDITEIPQDVRNIYKTVWEIKQRVLIDQSADRAPFVCQTQSLNLYFEDINQKVVYSATLHAWRRGLKTGSYYIRSRPAARAQQVTIDPTRAAAAAAAATTSVATTATTISQPVCDSCSG